MVVVCVVLLSLQEVEMRPNARTQPKREQLHLFSPTFSIKLPSSPPTFSERIMRTYFCILIALCIVLQTVQAVEMSPRARRQSDNLITLNIPRDLLNQLLESLLGQGGLGDILKNILGNGGGN
ncbi:uncharacterized protein TNCT_221651 [Trichonephila clavata]|uniref:Uncharacterized protein n=1 Tax=Trichonephila clavata TaxID=2740835 RepID=A0A8X6JTF8_TRICU|nr:uncharacterized protein TNCT_221651 [Trichonephila clavata]